MLYLEVFQEPPQLCNLLGSCAHRRCLACISNRSMPCSRDTSCVDTCYLWPGSSLGLVAPGRAESQLCCAPRCVTLSWKEKVTWLRVALFEGLRYQGGEPENPAKKKKKTTCKNNTKVVISDKSRWKLRISKMMRDFRGLCLSWYKICCTEPTINSINATTFHGIIQGWEGWDPEEADLVGGIHGRGDTTGWFLGSFPTQTYLWFSDIHMLPQHSFTLPV